MRSRRERGIAVAGAVALVVACAIGGRAQQTGTAEPISSAAIARAVEDVRRDPELSRTRTFRILQWKTPTTAPRAPSGWMLWIFEFFAWMASSTRVLVWAVVIAGVLALVAFLVRTARVQASVATARDFDRPTHVRELDIRPESLPADIGAAARALWDRGHHRAALSLLYRGLLSRLVHVHEVPIRQSSTEGDCVDLAQARLSHDSHSYVTSLVRVWQRAVYGQEAITLATVHGLCDGFAAALEPRPSADVPGRPA